MSTIVFASSKGGAGKTTAAILVACELARQGLSKSIGVALIDADPNQHSAQWASKSGCPANLSIIANTDESSLVDHIEQGQSKSAFVVVDLEGTASISVTHAIHCADLVVIPCQGSHDDAKEAIKTIKLIKAQSRLARRDIPFALLMTRTHPAIKPRGFIDIVNQFQQADLDLFDCTLTDREAFRAIRAFGGTVNNLPSSEVSGIEKACDNVFVLTKEIVQKLKANN